MKRLARSILLLLLLALSLSAQGVVSYPFTAGLPPSVPPGNVSCSTSGTTGTVTYYYWVVAIYTIGQMAPLGLAPSCVITNANATLNGSNFDVISWLPVSVPSYTSINYAVIRNTTSTWPGTGTTAAVASQAGTTFNDQSNSLNSFTWTAASPGNGQLIFDAIDGTVPFVSLKDSLGGNTQTFYSPNITYEVDAVVTQAQINAGFTLVPATGSQTLKVVSYFWKVNGAFATCTDVRLSDTSAGPVDITTILIAALTNGAILGEQITTSTTLNTFAAALTANQGIQIRKTGSACTGNTNVTVSVKYKVNS